MTDRKAYHTLLQGGARSGKTFLAIRAIIIRAFSYPRSRHLSLRLHRTSAEKYLWQQTLPAVVDKCFPDVGFVMNKSRLRLVCPNGSEYWFGGLDEGEKGEGLLGSDWNTIHYDELSEMPLELFLMSRTRLSLKTWNADRTKLCVNRSFSTINPTYKTSWVYRTFIDKFDVNLNLPMPEEQAERYNHYSINPIDNIDNLSPEFLRELEGLNEVNRNRFLYGVWSDESKDALFKLRDINRARIPTFEEAKKIHYDKIVVAVDPAVTSGNKSDWTGIVVVGWTKPDRNDRRSSGDYYVLEDCSIHGTPDEWAQRVFDAYVNWKADLVVGEVNQGGDLVEKNIRSVSRTIPFEKVFATRGKAVRAQPVVAACEQGRLHIVVCQPELEAEMTGWNPDSGEPSPNRLDAMVWGVMSLMGHKHRPVRVTVR